MIQRFHRLLLPLATVLTVALGTLLDGQATYGQTDRRPNVLFIAVDDLRPQLGCYGDTLVKSPNIDRLAARGLVFERAYCQQALCSPSRISLLSGRYPSTTRIFQIGPTLRSAMPDIVTLPQHFKNHGYFTRSLGKIYHVGIDDPASWSVTSWHSRKPRYGPEGMAKVRAAAQALREAGKKEPERGAGRSFYAGPAFESPDVADDDLLDGDTAREAIAALKQLSQDPGQPFFLAVGFANPHVPWVAPRSYWDQYPDDLPLPDNQFLPRGAPSYAARSGQDFYWYGNVPQDRQLSESFKTECLHGYLAAISYIDAQVGRLLESLDETGLAENTIVILWGDHGYYMGEHSWWGSKHNNYEGATHAPLIVAVPGQANRGAKTRALVEFVDIAPSLVELCGLPSNPGFEGRSFRSLVADPRSSIKSSALSWYPIGGYMGNAMRTDRYRYVEWLDKKGQTVGRELYDHESDPQENLNLADQPEQARLIEQLSTQLHGLGRIVVAR